MTYLELVNRVLRGLRENQITAITADYPRLIGQFVNEAKQDLEDAGPWAPLRGTRALALPAGDNTVDVGTTNERSYISLDSRGCPQMFVETVGFERRLSQIPYEDMRAMRLLNPDADAGPPLYFSLIRDEDGLSVGVYPAADIPYDLRIDVIVPQADLSDTTDELLVPSDPVWREALVRAMEERGEEFAGQIENARKRASDSAFNAILRDFGSSELTFESV